jgi:hypothetical protein
MFPEILPQIACAFQAREDRLVIEIARHNPFSSSAAETSLTLAHRA